VRYSDIQVLGEPSDVNRLKGDDPWKQEVWDGLRKVIGRGKDFSMDDLWDEVFLDPDDPDYRSKRLAANSLITRAKNLSLIEDTGRSVLSQSVAAHKRKITVWQPIRKRRLVRIGGSNGHH
jgi:hypothetical protein